MANNKETPKIETKNLSLWYGKFQALYSISMQMPEKAIIAIIGPSGCGKSTYLRVLNRMNDEIYGCRVKGQVFLNGEDIYGSHIKTTELRRRVGMVFQRPNPFPDTIYNNLVFGPKLHGVTRKSDLLDIVHYGLEAVGLQEFNAKLDQNALRLSQEQQQRLCMGRAIANKPEVLLLDEPCSSLDPQATSKIEELMSLLKKDLTIVIVTHNMRQAARVSDYTALFHLGKLIEFGTTNQIFTNPKEKITEDYISGKYG